MFLGLMTVKGGWPAQAASMNSGLAIFAPMHRTVASRTEIRDVFQRRFQLVAQSLSQHAPCTV
jgi:hypothetical protein